MATIASAFTISGGLERQDIYLLFVGILNTYVFGESKKIHIHTRKKLGAIGGGRNELGVPE